MGCDSSGFFSLFNGQSAQCGPVNNQIQQMRGQSRPDHHQPRAAAQRRHRRRRSRQPAPLGADRAGAEQLRPAICQCRAQGPGNFLDNLFGNNNNPNAPPGRCRPAIRHLPHRLRAHLRRRLFPDLVRHRAGALPRRREDLQGAVPGGRSDAVQPIAIPAKTSTRRCRSAASPIRRCRTRSNSAPSSIRPAPARPPARPGPTR